MTQARENCISIIVYILPLIMPVGKSTFLYADDTARVVDGKTSKDVADKLNASLTGAGTWFKNHRLSLTIFKTK